MDTNVRITNDKIKVIFIHGNGGGTAKDNWFPWLSAELGKLGVTVLAQDFPDPVEAKASIWLPFLEHELKADDNTILVGHSSGALAAMRYAETHKLLGTVLIGACYTDLGYESEKLSGYYDTPWNWEAIRQNQNWIAQFASTDDPFVPIAEARYIHEHLQCEYQEYIDQGHFGSDEKHLYEFPELLDLLRRKIVSK